MLRLVVQRLLFTVLVLLGATAIVFFLSHVIPSDPAIAALGEDASPEAVRKYRQELGLDRPLYAQYGRFVGRVLRGDLGVSIVSRRPVAVDLRKLMPATIELAVPSLVLAGVLGIVSGITSAVKAGRWIDHVSRLASLFGMSMPVFWLGLALQVIFFRWLGILPVGGRLPPGAAAPPTVTGFYALDALLTGDVSLAWLAARHLILPVITLTVLNLALMARMTRAVMLEVLRADYVRTARSKGLSERGVVYGHAMRNALIPLVTVFGLRVGPALGGAVITETVFAWPGVGWYAVQAIKSVDYPVVTSFTLIMCAIYAISNLLVDMSYAFFDPRIKHG